MLKRYIFVLLSIYSLLLFPPTCHAVDNITGFAEFSLKEIYNDNILLSESEPERGFTTELSPSAGLFYTEKNLDVNMADNLTFVFLPNIPGNDKGYYTHRFSSSASLRFFRDTLVISAEDTFSQVPVKTDDLLLFSKDFSGSSFVENLPAASTSDSGRQVEDTGVKDENLGGLESQSPEFFKRLTDSNRFSIGPVYTYSITPRTSSSFSYKFLRVLYKEHRLVDTSTHFGQASLSSMLSRQLTVYADFKHSLTTMDSNGERVAQDNISLRESYAFSPFVNVTGVAGYNFTSAGDQAIGNLTLSYNSSRLLKWSLVANRQTDFNPEGELSSVTQRTFTMLVSGRYINSTVSLYSRLDDPKTGDDETITKGGVFRINKIHTETLSSGLFTTVSQADAWPEKETSTFFTYGLSFSGNVSKSVNWSFQYSHQAFRDDNIITIKRYRANIYAFSFKGII